MSERNDATNIRRENDARACQQSLWIGLLQADRLGWADVVEPLMVLYEHVTRRRRDLCGGPGLDLINKAGMASAERLSRPKPR